ncbi:MAG: shikimate kinase [Firmicutes bacterium]|nr:shikimate kinase [Bacillota bacterium]
MKDNIVLTGIMGCGKTSLGKELADRLSMTFVDMDAIIEEESNMTISEMFSMYGEPYFRDRETELCHRLSDQTGLVISTGGGIIGREENMNALGRTGSVIFIDRDPNIIIRTIDASNRPMIRDNPQRLLELHAQRLPFYQKYADMIFPNNGTLEEAINSLMIQLKKGK